MRHFLLLLPLTLWCTTAQATDRRVTPGSNSRTGHESSAPSLTVNAARATATAASRSVARAQSRSASSASQTNAQSQNTSVNVSNGGSGQSGTARDNTPSLAALAAWPTASCERVAGLTGVGSGAGAGLVLSWGVEWCRVLMEAQIIERLFGAEMAQAHIMHNNERIRRTIQEARPDRPAPPVPAATRRPTYDEVLSGQIETLRASQRIRPAYCDRPEVQNPECR